MENDVLNQEVTTYEDADGIFDDIVSEDTTDKSTPAEPETVEPFLTVQYNKEDKALSKEEATTLAQKGMNYDKVYERFNKLNSTLENLAKKNGLDVETFLSNLNTTQAEYELESEINVLKEAYPNADEALLKELAEKRLKDKEATVLAEEQKAEKEEADSEYQAIEAQVKALNEVFPEVDPQSIPNNQEVMDLMRKGRTLLEAYMIYDRKVSSEKAKVQQTNELNKMRSLGNTDSSDIEVDDFLSGFNS